MNRNYLDLAEPTPRECKSCRKTFLPSGPVAKCLDRFNLHCPACSDAQDAAEAARLASLPDRRESEWKTLCPPLFFGTVREKLPDPRLFDRVLRWRFGPRGLLLHGQTGSGKSRVLWQLARREHFAGRRIRVLNCESGIRFAALYSDGADHVARWVAGLIGADILLCDDVMKTRLTDGWEGALFAIFDGRLEAGRPVLISSNDSADSLKSRLTPDRADALLRRIAESCEVVRA